MKLMRTVRKDPKMRLPRIDSLLQKYAELDSIHYSALENVPAISASIERLKVARSLIRIAYPAVSANPLVVMDLAAMMVLNPGALEPEKKTVPDGFSSDLGGTDALCRNLDIVQTRIVQLTALRAEASLLSAEIRKRDRVPEKTLRFLRAVAADEKTPKVPAEVKLPPVEGVGVTVMSSIGGSWMGAIIGFVLAYDSHPLRPVGAAVGALLLAGLPVYSYVESRLIRNAAILKLASQDFEGEAESVCKKFQERSSALSASIRDALARCENGMKELIDALLPRVCDEAREIAEEELERIDS